MLAARFVGDFVFPKLVDKAFFTETRQRWLLLLLTAFTFFILLGSRALNEPDEGRYSEIAREMIETGDYRRDDAAASASMGFILAEFTRLAGARIAA